MPVHVVAQQTTNRRLAQFVPIFDRLTLLSIYDVIEKQYR